MSSPKLTDIDRLNAELATVRQILEVHERTSFEQASRLEEALDRLEDQSLTLKLRASQLRKLSEAAMVVNANLTVQQILERVNEQAREIIGAHRSVTSLTVDQSGSQAINAVSLSDKYVAYGPDETTAHASNLYSYVCETNRPLRMSQTELEEHPRWRGSEKEQPNRPPMHGWLAVPLIARDGRNLGLIHLSDKYEGEFTPEDEDIMIQLAQTASAAIENANLYAEAQMANQAKDDFFAAISHELRTPMTSILGWARILSDDADREIISEAVQAITGSANAQAQLVDDLLDVSRIMTGKYAIERKEVDLRPLIEASVAALRPAAAGKGLALIVKAAEPASILGDPLRLRQVVSNLLSNAIKFTPSGGVIETRLSREEDHATIQVIDTGEGISPQFLPHVFDRYAQQSSRRHGGLGLGLAIVRHIVELHGGTCTASSQGEGKGSTFTVRLPSRAS